jgi:hypothetical protein
VLILAVLGTIVFGLATRPKRLRSAPSAASSSRGYSGTRCRTRRRAGAARVAAALGVFFIAVVWFILCRPRCSPRAAALGGLDVDARVRSLVRGRLPAGEAVADGEGVGVPHRQDLGDGVLALRRLLDLLGGVRAAGRQEIIERWVLSLGSRRSSS